jgi:hypothetical protein
MLIPQPQRRIFISGIGAEQFSSMNRVVNSLMASLTISRSTAISGSGLDINLVSE